ncbi:AMP-dependent synthetase and ligase [Gloeothece citriformis PCC 7424]|uniref:AMP-dependent synthetase and ligase n=1 Tax=Gloeothece citriformis (strain PCC 7424) TaxID=65393 RepID=B7KIG9_GLOC7|nr:2-succinylbenzoate--CoA ligase [Gloeothece citriformis]ACK69375.1 AMP-dependent synthetase and ligase [Gloeothece citriformis PCC 7424]
MINLSGEQILTHLKQRCQDHWLIGYDNEQLYHLTQTYYQEIQTKQPANIFLIEENPIQFIPIFLAASAANCPIFLCNPDWQQTEWEQILNIVQPDLIPSINQPKPIPIHPRSSAFICGQKFPKTIMIPTGGSSGKIRFTIHTWETLTASVRGFYQYFTVPEINSFCILPLYHVSGLMQILRSFLTGGKCKILSYHSLKQQINKLSITEINPKDYFISLVPTQLQFLLQNNPQWLSQFSTVLTGGAPAWPSLLQQARQDKIRLAPTYGMTETASQVVTLKPEDFLQGNNSSGQVLPHAKITLSEGKRGAITIGSDSLFLGYYPNKLPMNQVFETDDIGEFDSQNYLSILGRNSQKIITGGEKVYPSEIEAAILETQLVQDVAVFGLADSHWGEMVTAIYVANDPEISLEIIKNSLKTKISPYKIPKKWIAVKGLPRNSQGKINYQQLPSLIN